MRISSITKNAGKACNNRLYRHIRTFEKIVKNYFVIYLKDHRCVKVRKNLRDYEFELAGKGLVRVHAGYMVAMKYCAKIEKGQIVMEDGTEIPISRDRKNMVKEQFMISRRK